MKTKSFLLSNSLLLCFILVFAISCKKDDVVDEDILNEKVEFAYQKIKETADVILLSDDPIAGFETMASEYIQMEEVEKVEVRHDGMFVKFSNNRIVGWYIPPAFDYSSLSVTLMSSIEKSLQMKQVLKVASNNASSKSICLIDQQYGEAGDQEDREYYIHILDSIYSENGWNVDKKIGPQVTLDFIGTQLNSYDVVYFIAHGAEFDNKTWILTNSVDYDFGNKFGDLLSLAFSLSEIRMRQDGLGVVKSSFHYAFNSEYIEKSYSKGSFSGNVIYMVACQSMGSRGHQNLSMPKAFTEYGGAAVYIGWDETNYAGEVSGVNFLSNLLEGFSISAIYDFLQINNEQCIVNKKEKLKNSKYDAHLRYYPETAGNFRLVQPPTEAEINQSIKNLFSEEVINEIKSLGQPIYNGNNPPIVYGSYKVSPVTLKNKNISSDFAIGHVFDDTYLTFSNQNNSSLTIDAKKVHSNEKAESTTAYITGSGNNFTIYADHHASTDGVPHRIIEVYSGTLTTDGVTNLHYTLLMIDNGGSTNSIKNGQARLFYDSDGFSEKIVPNGLPKFKNHTPKGLPRDIDLK